MEAYNPFYYVFIVTLFFTAVYYIVGLIVYFVARKTPHI